MYVKSFSEPDLSALKDAIEEADKNPEIKSIIVFRDENKSRKQWDNSFKC